MKLSVFYDYTCPYCYLCSRNLDGLSSEFDLHIEWKGIEIHPEFPKHGQKSLRSLISMKAAERIKETAKETGIDIVLPGFRTNSRLSLEASEFAKISNRFAEVHAALYEAYFLQRKNIGDVKIVLEICERAGLDRTALEECLNERTMYHRIEENKKEAAQNQILGVPTLIIGKLPVHGNQSIETLRLMIKRALERTA
jgi:predicted DsbA family dithiol-disulfide isomerase